MIKMVYRDHNHTSVYEQPVILNNEGKAVVYGEGSYTVVVLDSDYNLLLKYNVKRNSNRHFKFGSLARSGIVVNGKIARQGKVYFAELIDD